jgi:hypothetical protein
MISNMTQKTESEQDNYLKLGLYRKPKEKLINLLDLHHDEKILINLRLIPLRTVFINNNRERFPIRLILTTQRVIFFLNRGYLIKEFFAYNKITSIVVTRKWYSLGQFPAIIIKTASDVYEVLFPSLFPYKKKFNGIIECIKKRNTEITIEMNLKSHIKEIADTKIEFK